MLIIFINFLKLGKPCWKFLLFSNISFSGEKFFHRIGERESVQFPSGGHDCQWHWTTFQLVHSGDPRE